LPRSEASNPLEHAGKIRLIGKSYPAGDLRDWTVQILKQPFGHFESQLIDQSLVTCSTGCQPAAHGSGGTPQDRGSKGQSRITGVKVGFDNQSERFSETEFRQVWPWLPMNRGMSSVQFPVQAESRN
jgi:hypothetical protein